MSSTEKLLEALKNDKNKKTGFGPRPKRLVMKDQDSYLNRILPNKTDPDGLPYERIFLHFGFLHPNFGNPSTFRCLGRGCPLCKAAKKMAEDRVPDAWKFKSTPVYLYYVMDENDDFKFIRLSNTANTAVVDAITAAATGKVNPVDLDKGRWAEIKITKMEDKTIWKCSFQHDPHSVPQQIRQELKIAPELSEIYREYTLKELELIVAGKKLPMEYNNAKVEKEVVEEGSDTAASAPTKAMRSSTVEDEPPAEETIEEKRERIKKKINGTLEKKKSEE
jgi:hypothetical protein